MVEGQDELAKLAQGLDIMRKMLVYREEKESMKCVWHRINWCLAWHMIFVLR